MYIAVLDIAQYDCPIVKLTDMTESVEIVVIGANVSEINNGYERIYITIRGEDKNDTIKAIENLQKIEFVKSFRILSKKNNEARVYLYITKTRAMEASVNLDATPIAPWISINGVERWILGFPSRKQIYEYISLVKEQDVIENMIIREVSDELIMESSLRYLATLNLISSIRKLTDSQLNILKIALRNGYYEWPRRTNIVELSSKLNVSRAAVTKLLRRAEYKVIKSIIEFIESNKKFSKKSSKKIISRPRRGYSSS